MDKGWYIWGPIILALLIWLFIAVRKAEKGNKKVTAYGCLIALLVIGGGPLIFLFNFASSIKWDGDHTVETNSGGVEIIEKFTYLDEEKHGLYKSYYKISGKLQREGSYERGKNIGRWTTWYDNGQKESETDYSKYTPYRVLTEWHENGKMMSQEYYKKNSEGKDDWIESKNVGWHENGQKSYEGSADKYTDGIASEWHENGQLFKKETWSGGKLLEIEIYDDEGKSCRLTTYKNGSGYVAEYYGPWSFTLPSGPSKILLYENYKVIRVLEDN